MKFNSSNGTVFYSNLTLDIQWGTMANCLLSENVVDLTLKCIMLIFICKFSYTLLLTVLGQPPCLQ